MIPMRELFALFDHAPQNVHGIYSLTSLDEVTGQFTTATPHIKESAEVSREKVCQDIKRRSRRGRAMAVGGKCPTK
jgi:hypothetical protein